jgi:hypothetical protein
MISHSQSVFDIIALFAIYNENNFISLIMSGLLSKALVNQAGSKKKGY